MAVMGDLTDFDVGLLLQMLALRQGSGRLQIAAGGDEVALYLEGGRLVQVTSTRLPLRLGRLLQANGLVDARRLHEALRRQRGEGHARSLGEILVAQGWVSAAEIARCVEEQCIVVVARVVAADHGSFAWTPGVPVPARVAAVPLNADRILIEATRRVDELRRLWGRLPPPHAPLVPSLRAGLDLAPLGELDRKVMAVLAVGAASVAEVVDFLPVDERAILRTLVGLLERGLVVAGYGAPGEQALPGGTPPSEADLAALSAD